MFDTLSETQGCDLLTRLFTKRGYAIKRNVQFREHGVEFHIDGWDARARVGFEFLTSEDEDHDDLTLEEYKELTAAQRRGDLALFIIDEVEPLSAQALAAEAHEFLDEVADAAHARLKAAARRKRAAARPAAKKPAARAAAAAKPKVVKAARKKGGARPARMPAATTTAKKKPARVKPAGKKASKPASKKARR